MRQEHADKAILAAELIREVHAKYPDDELVARMHESAWTAFKPWSHLMTNDQLTALSGGTK